MGSKPTPSTNKPNQARITGLFNEDPSLFDKDILFEQYKLYVESANLTSSLRNQSNTFFSALNVALLSVIVSMREFFLGANIPLWIIFMCCAGITINIGWWFAINSYKTLNSRRFRIIHEIEGKLPASIYRYEWELLVGNKATQIHFRQTNIEQLIPVIFSGIYIFIIVLILVGR